VELSNHQIELAQDYFGRFVLKNCKVEQYKKKKDAWLYNEIQNEKKQQLFDDFLPQKSSQEHSEKRGKSEQVTKLSKKTDQDEIENVFSSATQDFGSVRGKKRRLKDNSEEKDKKKHKRKKGEKKEETQTKDPSLAYVLQAIVHSKS